MTDEIYDNEIYELIGHVIQVTGMVSVWADDQEDNTVDLCAYPLHFLGVADWVVRTYRGTTLIRTQSLGNVVVGLDLCEGSFQICQECTNFAGICRVGEDVYKATAYLRDEYRKRLRPRQVEKGGPS